MIEERPLRGFVERTPKGPKHSPYPGILQQHMRAVLAELTDGETDEKVRQAEAGPLR